MQFKAIASAAVLIAAVTISSSASASRFHVDNPNTPPTSLTAPQRYNEYNPNSIHYEPKKVQKEVQEYFIKAVGLDKHLAKQAAAQYSLSRTYSVCGKQISRLFNGASTAITNSGEDWYAADAAAVFKNHVKTWCGE